MAYAPLVDCTPGLYQVCTSANTDYPVAIPTAPNARALVVWFETSTSDSTIIRGRVAFDKDGTVVGSITGADTLLGYHPPIPVEYSLAVVGTFSGSKRLITHVHLACATAGAVARGMWLYGS